MKLIFRPLAYCRHRPAVKNDISIFRWQLVLGHFAELAARLNPIEIAVIGATLYFGGSALRRSPWRSRGLGYRTSKACAHCGIHPSARDIQEPVSNFLISCQLSKAHAFAGVVHTFFVCGHGGCSFFTGGAGKEPYPAILDQARRKTEVPARSAAKPNAWLSTCVSPASAQAAGFCGRWPCRRPVLGRWSAFDTPCASAL